MSKALISWCLGRSWTVCQYLLIGELVVACKGAAHETTHVVSQATAPGLTQTPASSDGAPSALPTGGELRAFPGAEGFGAQARGGRGGSVCKVTSLAKEGPGSLAACLDQRGPRTVIFETSGVIDGPLELKNGHVTLAGQTSPRGISIKGGLTCDNVYDPNDCNDVIIRFLRFRQGTPDGLRVGGARDVIVDHASFAQAEDENIEITRSSNVTVQWSVIAEPVGDHYKWGGVLINYSKDVMPLDGITLHHDVWNGVAGRLPEISCEENDDGPGKTNCSGHTARIELTNNLMWDASDPIWFNRCTGTNQGNDCAPSAKDFRVALNLVGNILVRRSGGDSDAPLIEQNIWSGPVFAQQNRLGLGTRLANVQSGSQPNRHAFPAVTQTPEQDLAQLLGRVAGALPKDAMDARLAAYLTRSIDERPRANDGNVGLVQKDALSAAPAASPPRDSDNDGMPDAWEASHGFDAQANDAAVLRGCAPGYTALECYLNELADQLIASAH